jgi:hypothetical protein
MKTAFFLVLLANLTLLMYEYHRGAFDRAAEVPAPEAAMLREPIMLASERKGEPQSAKPTRVAEAVQDQDSMRKTTDAVQQNAKPAALVCYEVGPFANEQILKDWSKAAIEIRGAVKPVMRNAQEIIDYLVLYPTAGTRQDIKAAMQLLHEQSITDAYPLATGEHKGHISLGAFHREAQALRMQKDLQGRGVEAVVKPRFKEASRKYALFTGAGAASGRLDELRKKYPALPLKALPADDPACLEGGTDRSESSVPAVARSAVKQAILPENPAFKADSKKLSDSLADTGGENSALKAVAPVIGKAPVQPQPKQQNGAAEIKTVSLACYEAGPFPNEQSMGAWQKQVIGMQGLIKPVFREGKVISDYLVVYPSSGSAESTKADMQMLREHGLSDAWPLPSGDEKGQISLGVFNKEENAAQMQKGLLDKGVNSVVKPRYKNKRQKYLLISIAEPNAGSLQSLEKNHPGINLRRMPNTEQNCPKSHSGPH